MLAPSPANQQQRKGQSTPADTDEEQARQHEQGRTHSTEKGTVRVPGAHTHTNTAEVQQTASHTNTGAAEDF